MEQRTQEWYAARVGKVTASRIADVVARTKTGWGASRDNYMAQLIVERLTGVPVDGYTNAAMQWGIEHEADAIAAYEFEKDATVKAVGFIDHPKIPMAGASPDGRVGKPGGVEIKCPVTATHIEYLLSQDIPQKYIYQMQWQRACDGRKWTDFVSYDPRLPVRLRLFVKRVPRDNALIASLEKDVAQFIVELEERLEKLGRIAA